MSETSGLHDTLLFDTDVLIWYLRGHKKASDLIKYTNQRYMSLVSYLEILQGLQSGKELKQIKQLIHDLSFVVLPLTENIGHRAAIYMEEYVFQFGIGLADALIAATALENDNLVLATGNEKHFKMIPALDLKVFHP